MKRLCGYVTREDVRVKFFVSIFTFLNMLIMYFKI
jgi:hypothetical protein